MVQVQDKLIEEICEALSESTDISSKILAGIQILLNYSMLFEREAYLNAKNYERTDQRTGYSNGYKNRVLKTRVGKIDLKIPQTRDGDFYPQSLEKGCRSERALKIALAEMYLAGVSTGKVKRITEEMCGFEVSSSQVSRATKELDDTFQQFRDRPLGKFKAMLADARYEKVRYGGCVQDLSVLWAIGITEDGKREVLGVSVALSEAEVHWRQFFESLVKRGLNGLEYIVSDDHAGLRAAMKSVFPNVKWNRCQYHLAQNAQNHVSKKGNKLEVGADVRAIFQSASEQLARTTLNQFMDKWKNTEPKLVQWAEMNIPEGFTVYTMQASARKRLRTSNLIERYNKEIKRRTKVVGIFPNEDACLRLVTGILIEIHDTWISDDKAYVKFSE